jgi:DNA modification methylase
MLQEHAGDRKETRVHPTQKPLPLMRWCLTLAPDAQTILDPFMGSGTTLVAAKLEGRKSVGIEISEKYCEIAANRLRQRVLQFDEVCA